MTEDIFIRKFMHGTWPEAFVSLVMIKRHHNIIRIAGIINRSMKVSKANLILTSGLPDGIVSNQKYQFLYIFGGP
jgi:small subunit ribosomal protein S24